MAERASRWCGGGDALVEGSARIADSLSRPERRCANDDVNSPHCDPTP